MSLGIADEETTDEMEKGPVAYQESKVFNTEPTLVTVYDNLKKRLCTFETYGLDSQQMLYMKYDYQAFDNLFRFNAELMNPNRKEGRFHWVIERLEIVTIGNDIKLRLGATPTLEVPQLPLYEEKRKIPTGRMDLKERQRLRESMDQLDIRREANIQKKRAATRERFLRHIFRLKEEDAKNKAAVEEKIRQEVADRYKLKEKMEREEEENEARLKEKAKIRRKAVEVKEVRTEEAEEESLRQLRLRWKAQDKEKAKIIAEARARKAKLMAQAAEDAAALKKKRGDASNKRNDMWRNRDRRIKHAQDNWLKDQMELKQELRRKAKMMKERNQEFLKDLHRERQPIFAAQLVRTAEREKAARAEEKALKMYADKRAIPKKAKTKGKNSAKAAKKAALPKKAPKSEDEGSPEKKPKAKAKKKADGEKGDKKKADADGDDKHSDGEDKEEEKDPVDRALDAVESKMRAEMEMQKRREKLDKIREDKMRERAEARKQKEILHDREYRQKYENEVVEKEKQARQRHMILKDRQAEAEKASTRKKLELEKLNKVRARNVEAIEKRRLEKACGVPV